jgi:UDP-N-acetylglucosamine 3-dehydrogenase
MKKLRIGVVGLGRVATKTHIPVLRSLKNVEVSVGAEKNPERAERVKDLFGLERIYDDYEKMYSSENLNGVYICLPNFLHKDASIKALKHGLHVLCEKPMGVSVEEAAEMSRLAEEQGLFLMPGFKKRYAPNFKKAKNVIDSGLLGKIIQVQGAFVTPGPYISWDPKSDWYLEAESHGAIYDSGCHLADLLFYLIPHRVKKVKMVAVRGFSGFDIPTNVSVAFEMEEGIVGDVTIGTRVSADVLSFSIYGTAGTINVGRDFFSYVHAGTDYVDKLKTHFQNISSECGEIVRKISDKVNGRNFYREDLSQAESFCNAISGIERPTIGGKDAIKVHEFLEALTSSVNT